MLEVTAVPAFSDNYFWLLHRPGEARAAIVDPGDAEPVEAALAARGLQLASILITHHHPDHIGGVAALAERWKPQILSPVDSRIPVATARVQDGERVRIEGLGLDFDVLAVPGHTSTHVAYYRPGTLLCGDTLFALGCGRLFDGTAAQLLASLDRISALPGDTLAYCAHEYTLSNAAFALETQPGHAPLVERIAAIRALRARGAATVPMSIAEERASNPFLRIDDPSLRTRVAQVQGVEPTDRVASFAALRRWKDGYQPPADWFG